MQAVELVTMPRWLQLSTPERFWAKVDKNGPTIRLDLGACWIWKAALHDYGYGLINIDGRPLRAHRVAWEMKNGPIPRGMCVLHKCDNPPCVNLSHLFLGTRTDNNHDAMNKGRTIIAGAKRAKLNERLVKEIRTRYDTGNFTYSDLAMQYSVSFTNIAAIVTRRSWRKLV